MMSISAGTGDHQYRHFFFCSKSSITRIPHALRILIHMWRALLGLTRPTSLLGRWCHPLSHPKCNQNRKADLANLDNSFVAAWLSPTTADADSSPSPPASRDPVSVFSVD